MRGGEPHLIFAADDFQFAILLATRYCPKYMESAAAPEILDQEWMRSMLIRWRLSEAFLSSTEAGEAPEESALRTIITRDIPLLIKELLRLRPELAIPPANL